MCESPLPDASCAPVASGPPALRPPSPERHTAPPAAESSEPPRVSSRTFAAFWANFGTVAILLGMVVVLAHVHYMIWRTGSLLTGSFRNGPVQRVHRPEPRMVANPSGPSTPDAVARPGGNPQHPLPPPAMSSPVPPDTPRKPTAATPSSEGAPSVTTSGIDTLPLSEILAALRRLIKYPEPESRLTARQAHRLIAILKPELTSWGHDDLLFRATLTRIVTTLTDSQKRYIIAHPYDANAIRTVGGSDPLGESMLAQIQTRAGVQADALPAPQALTVSPDVNEKTFVYQEGLLVLDASPDQELTRQQARAILPYLAAQSRVHRHQQALRLKLVAVLTTAQRERILSLHDQIALEIPQASPQVVVSELNRLVAKSGST